MLAWMKSGFLGHTIINIAVVVCISLVVVPLACCLVALWVDKHRFVLRHRRGTVIALPPAAGGVQPAHLEAA